MNVQIHARNFDANEQLQSYVEKKLSRLDRYLPTILDVRVDVTYDHRRAESDRAAAQLTVRDARGTILRAEEKGKPDVFAAIDAALDKLYRQINRYKDKRRRHSGRAFEQIEPEFAAAEMPPGTADGNEGEGDNGTIIRRKQIPLTPMNEQEAIDQMELLGHTFFVFYNADSAAINVLYKRDNGDFGLLVPNVE